MWLRGITSMKIKGITSMHKLRGVWITVVKMTKTLTQISLIAKLLSNFQNMSHPMGKPTICICENKDADQLRGNREADQRLCFRYSDSTIPPLLNSKISSF